MPGVRRSPSQSRSAIAAKKTIGAPPDRQPRLRAARLPPAERSAKLVEAAIDVLADHGIGHTNHSMIAERAHVSLATVFKYFPDHERLTEAAIARVSTYLMDEIIKRSLHDGPPDRAIERMLLNFSASIAEHPSLTRIWLDWSTAVRDATWPSYLDFHASACAQVGEAIRLAQSQGSVVGALDPDDAAHVIVGLGHMIAHMTFAGSPRARIRRVVRSLTDHYLAIGSKTI